MYVADVELTDTGIVLPTDRVGIVCLQPFLKLTGEPFRCLPASRGDQLAALPRVLDIAKLRDHGADKTHFTIIPEYGIPGLDGVLQIENALRRSSWPSGTIIIGGTDALTKNEYRDLCEAAATSVDQSRNGPEYVSEGEWVNCCVTWVKAGNPLCQ